MECCRDGSPSGRFSHLHRGTMELCLSDHQVLGYLPDQGRSSTTAQFGWAASSRRSLSGSKLLPFKNDGGHCSWGPKCFGTLPQICASTQSCLYRQFLRPLGLVFALTCTVNCGTLYIPNHVQSNSNQVETSRMSNGNRMHLSSISSLIAKGLNTCVKTFYFAKKSKNLFSLCLYGVWCLDC